MSIDIKSKVLLILACSMITFAVALAVTVLDVNVYARIAALLAVFVSGFGCCSIGYMLGWNKDGVES